MKKVTLKEESQSFHRYLITECKCSEKTSWDTARIIDRLLDVYTTEDILSGNIHEMAKRLTGYKPSIHYMNNAWRYSVSKYKDYKHDNR